MFDILFEGRLTVYALLAAVAVILLALWYRDRKPRWLIGGGFVALLMGIYALLDVTVETRREEINRKLQEMAAAVKRKDADAISKNLSESFTWEGMDKKTFRLLLEASLKTGIANELALWEETPVDDNGRFVFRAKPKGPSLRDAYFRVRSEWVRDGDGQWRLKTFTVHNIADDSTFPLRSFLPQ